MFENPTGDIDSVVAYMLRLPYIKRINCYQGSFPDESDRINLSDQNAYLLFEVQKEDEPQLEELIRVILSKSHIHEYDFIVNINKRYYVPPESIDLKWGWNIEIVPFKSTVNKYYPAQEKINATLRGITFLENTLQKYLQTKNL
jgi:hypothetical protein